jgi:hypothetical protein
MKPVERDCQIEPPNTTRLSVIGAPPSYVRQWAAEMAKGGLTYDSKVELLYFCVSAREAGTADTELFEKLLEEYKVNPCCSECEYCKPK